MGFTKISVNGEMKRVSKMTLKEMQTWVGGYIEISGNVICNEDGKMLNLPTNKSYPLYVGNIIIKDSNQKM